MKIVCDDKIPYILPALKELADEVVLLPGHEIGPEEVADAEILVIRTRTHCNHRLLKGSQVRLVVTATIGFDHIDTHWLENHGIQWANCPGCNATSVAQYILCSLLALQQDRTFRLQDATVGIVGVGHVGTAVAASLQAAGVGRLLLCDPPRQLVGDLCPEGLEWNSMSRLQAEADVITFHTPLTRKGPFATEHLADEAFFKSLHRRPVIINAARGGVVDESALICALDTSSVREAIIDTWEHEPNPRHALLSRAYICTPHIAGYSADGKMNATRMTLEHICHFLHRPMNFKIQPPSLPADFVPSADANQLALQLYDPRADSRRLRDNPEAFERLRNDYPLRRESCT